MNKKCFLISIYFPLGEKKGKLFLEKTYGQVKGKLMILNHEEMIYGTIDHQGNCVFEGIIKTLTRKIVFHAIGKIENQSLELEIRDGENIYILKGTEVQNGEVF